MSQEQQIGTRSNLVRGRSQASIGLIDAMYEICAATQPITGRGVGYKLFSRGLISSMSTKEMRKVYRLLKLAREDDTIPWEWIVDETRSLERTSQWSDPDEFIRSALSQYRRDFWDQQPVRVEVWSEKGTVRGVLEPILEEYGVGFRVMHGFSGATPIYNVAQNCDGRELIVLYVGDFDPSGMWMSCHDLPERLAKYGGDHVSLMRIALESDDANSLPSFPASDKKRDPRYPWFVARFGNRCAELDAMDPNDLRDVVERWIKRHIEPEAWERCEVVQAAEKQSLENHWLKRKAV